MHGLPRTIRGEAEKLGLSFGRVIELQDRNELETFVINARAVPNVDPILIANWMDKHPILGDRFAEFLKVVGSNSLSNTAADRLYQAIKDTDMSPEAAFETMPAAKSGDVQAVVEAVMAANPAEVCSLQERRN